MNKQEFQKLRVKIVLNHLQVFGIINVPINGYRCRLSDLLNHDQDFIALTDVKVYEQEKLIEKTSFMCINKHAIILLSEVDISQSGEMEHSQVSAGEKTDLERMSFKAKV
jgi:hypothetical protein